MKGDPLYSYASMRRSLLEKTRISKSWLFEESTSFGYPKFAKDKRDEATTCIIGSADLILKGNLGKITGAITYKLLDDTPDVSEYSFHFEHAKTKIIVSEDFGDREPALYGFHYDYDERFRYNKRRDHPAHHFSHSYLRAPRFRLEKPFDEVQAFERILGVVADIFYVVDTSNKGKPPTVSSPEVYLTKLR